jgi:putative nucleotidyltransferase with HDIG domain
LNQDRLDMAHMSLEPSFQEQEMLADTFARNRTGSTMREFVEAAVSAAGFAAAVAALWWARPPHGVVLIPALLCVLALAVATRVELDTPLGYTAPTQLAFVPLLFTLPPALVPLGVIIALTLGRLPDVVTGRLRAERLVHVPGNAWFSIGPVAVLAIAGVDAATAGPIVLVAALAAQFAVDFAVSAARFALTRGATVASQLRDSWVYVVDAALTGVGLAVGEQVNHAPIAVLSLLPLLGLLAVFARERHQRLESMLELSSAYRGTALVLGDVIEADDGYTGEHCKSVVSLCLDLAEHLDLGPERQRNLEFAALLHDVGKIAIPKEIINKPGKLDPHEWTIIKTHTVEGQKMLDRVGGFMREVGLIVRSHHERWDGGGYPDGLAGEQIPLEARIIACCDTWNAMRTDRPYRRALSVEVAVAELRSNAGKQFDPGMVDAFLRIVAPEAVSSLAPSATSAPASAPGPAAAPAPVAAPGPIPVRVG